MVINYNLSIASKLKSSCVKRTINEETSNEVKIELITTEKEFRQLKGDWNRLIENTEGCLFLRYEWQFCWWQHFGRHPRRKLHILTFKKGDELIGIAPFFRGESFFGPWKLQTRLNLMGSGTDPNEMFGYLNDYGFSDFLDVIVHRSHKNKVAESLANYLNTNSDDIDIIRLQHLSEESFIVNKVLPLLDFSKLVFKKKVTDVCPFLNLPDTLDEFIKQTGPSSRRRRLRKNLETAGKEYKVKNLNSFEEVGNGLDELINLHQLRWNSLGYPGAFFDERYLNFVKDFIWIAHNNKWLRFKKAIDQKGVSTLRLAIDDGRNLYDYLSGFDDSAPSAKHSPGLGLLSVMIKESIESEMIKVEFLRGDERYKFDFTDDYRKNWSITIKSANAAYSLKCMVNICLLGMANLYNRVNREWTLLKVQRKNKGLISMVFSFAAFRYNRVKEKLSKKKRN